MPFWYGPDYFSDVCFPLVMLNTTFSPFLCYYCRGVIFLLNVLSKGLDSSESIFARNSLPKLMQFHNLRSSSMLKVYQKLSRDSDSHVNAVVIWIATRALFMTSLTMRLNLWTFQYLNQVNWRAKEAVILSQSSFELSFTSASYCQNKKTGDHAEFPARKIKNIRENDTWESILHSFNLIKP